MSKIYNHITMKHYRQVSIEEGLPEKEGVLYNTDLGLMKYQGEGVWVDMPDEDGWCVDVRVQWWLKEIEAHVLTEEELIDAKIDILKKFKKALGDLHDNIKSGTHLKATSYAVYMIDNFLDMFIKTVTEQHLKDKQ